MSGAAVLAAFDSEASLMGAVRALKAAGFVPTEICSPFPLVSFAGRAADPPNRIPGACLAGAVVGATMGTTLQVYISAVSWPLNIGGKPILSWLAYLPVSFEFAILGAVFGAFGAFLWRAFRATDGLAQTLSDGMGGGRFLIRLEVRDAGDAVRAARILRGLGARPDILAIDSAGAEGEKSGGDGGWRRGTLLLVAGVGATSMLLAMLLMSDPTRPAYVYAPDMADSPAATTYAPEAVRADGGTLRARVPGTVARGPLPLHYSATEEDALRAAVELRMPPDIATEQDTTRGETLFRQLCQTCHGAEGHGDGVTMQRGFQPPASLLTQHARDMEDGQMFHVLTYGQKLMPSHAPQLTVPDRWRLISYVRSLQDRLPVDPPPFEPAPGQQATNR